MSKRKVTIAKRADASSTAVPRIRFKGFEGEWLRYQIGDCFEERDERTADGELLSVTIGSGVIPARDNGKLDNSSADKSNYKKVCVGDLAYNSMRMWQGACGASVFAGIVSPAYTVMNPKAGHDSLFYQYLFKTDEILRIFQSRSQGMTSDTWNLKFPLLKAIALNVPLLKEQKHVATFFSDLEQEIASALARGSKLRQLKQSMLVKMFPQRGKTIPEVRFSEFKGEWLRVPLSEIAVKVTEKNVSREHVEVFTNSAEQGVVSQRDYFDFDVAKNLGGYYVVRPKDFVYNPRISREAPVGPININALNRIGVMSPLYFVFRTHDIDTSYLQVLFKTRCWHPFMYFNGDSGARSDRFSIKNDVFMRMPISMPKDIAEQQKIGAFFKNLDSLIAAAEKRVAKLRQVKASLLERMFV